MLPSKKRFQMPIWCNEAAGGWGEWSPRTDNWSGSSKQRCSSCMFMARPTSKSFPMDGYCSWRRPKKCAPRDCDLKQWKSHSILLHRAHSEGSLCKLGLRSGRGSLHYEHSVDLAYVQESTSARCGWVVSWRPESFLTRGPKSRY